tara:strand:- start:660 stop:1382 length:723 start_codon:yes stop_codon:yes gene_type:complete
MTSRSVRLNNGIKAKSIDIYNFIYIFEDIILFITIWGFIFVTLITLINNNIFILLHMMSNNIYLLCINKFSDILNSIENRIKNRKKTWRRLIYDRANKEPYLIRYYLLFTNREKFPFNVFIHKFMKGDDDEDPHDHPWGFFHIILSGGYWEEVPVNNTTDINKRFDNGFCKIWRRAGYWNIVNSDYTHRIDLKENNTKPWTLFIPLNKNNIWGFWVKKDNWCKINSEIYLEKKNTFKIKK